jgi:hypothetical protein
MVYSCNTASELIAWPLESRTRAPRRPIQMPHSIELTKEFTDLSFGFPPAVICLKMGPCSRQ